MKSLKGALRNLVISLGYDIRKTSHIGLDSQRDLKRIFANKPVKTIFDVGAHVGESAADYVEQFPEAAIYCFEPFPETFAALTRNTEAWPTVTAINQAVGDCCGSQPLYVNKFSATNSLLEALPDVADATTRGLLERAGCVETTVTTLDVFCQEKTIAAIDLLKLDVQGFESKVLAGAAELLATNRIAAVYTEVTFESHYAGQTTWLDLYTTLTKYGFQLVDFYGHTRNYYQAARWCDALFVNSTALERTS